MNYGKFFYTLIPCLLSASQADVVLDWNAALRSAARASRMDPPRFSRVSAITHLAIYDAANGVQRLYRPYHVTAFAPSNTSVEAAISAAGYMTTMALFTNSGIQTSNLTALFVTSLATIPDGTAKVNGLAWGSNVANAILTLRVGDGSTNSGSYTNGTTPGVWRPTLPANAPALLPLWGEVTPFAVPPPASQLRCQQPPVLTSSAYALEWEITRAYGASNSVVRTPDQTEIARFWSDGGGTETPPGHWNHIASDVSVAQGLTLLENARLFALLNIAEADAAICSWDAKFAYNLWRPITAIREADTDGNPATAADPNWLPLIATPPFPEFTSGHSTFSRSAATVLARYFGTDAIAFTTGSDGLPGVTRNYPGFSAAADESGISRIYGGIHWESANISAQTMGHTIGKHVSEYYLLPLSAARFAQIKRANESAELTVLGASGQTYLIQASVDLRAWTDIATIVAVNGEMHVTDSSPAPHRFYRAIAQH